jgi:hypothetical protein
MYVPFAGIDRILYLCEFLSVLGISRLVQGVHTRVVRKTLRSQCKECTRTQFQVQEEHVRWAHQNSHKLRRDSARSAQSERKECSYTHRSVKSQKEG